MTNVTKKDGVTKPKRRKPRTVSKFNVKMMEKLQKALEADPRADLLALLSDSYSSRREDIKLEEEEYQQYLESEQVAQEVLSKNSDQMSKSAADESAAALPEGILPQAMTEVIFELSVEAKTALRLDNLKEGENITTALGSLLRNSKLLCSPNTKTHLFRCHTGLVVKCYIPEQAANGKDFTQYTSIQYLETQIPSVPAPKAHGLLVSGRMAYMLMTYIPGQTLEDVWPLLTNEQKIGLRDNLESILNQMRSHVNQSSKILGGTQGEGCKDTRRATRISSKPCQSSTSFYSFAYGNPGFGTPKYIQSVQAWMPASPNQRIVFTHGDLRPANIHVVNDKDGYHISGLLDWEMSGFYPEWWEACKITNCMSTIDTWDWYLYLPPCVSPAEYANEWLTDQFWDRFLLGQSGIFDIE